MNKEDFKKLQELAAQDKEELERVLKEMDEAQKRPSDYKAPWEYHTVEEG